MNIYTLSLLATEGKYSCVKAAKILELTSHDKLTRFLAKMSLKYCPDYKTLPKGGQIIFDDSLVVKNYARMISKINRLYCSSQKRTLYGLCFILVLYVYQEQVFILDVILWEKGLKTKNELARICLQNLKDNKVEPESVLFDRWYNAYPTLNLIESFGWKYVTLAKKDRILEEEKITAHKFFGAKGIIGKANKVDHDVQIIKYKKKYIMTNILKPLYAKQAWKKYQRRWIIETIFRDLKSFLHLEECSSRPSDSQISHFICSLEAYLYLREEYPSLSIESAHNEFLQKFRNSKSFKDKLLVQAA